MELETQQPNALDPIERFNNRYEVDPESDCWEWTGYVKEGTGYGEMSVNGENHGAHRISYRIHHGEIPDGAWILHECHNQSCVNPDHLYAGDVRDNVQDAMEEGSFWHSGQLQNGEENPQSKLTTAQVKEMKTLARDTDMSRQELADRFDTVLSNVYAILDGRTWTHVDPE